MSKLAQADAAIEAEAKRLGISKAELHRRLALEAKASEPAAPLVHVKMPPAMKEGLEAAAKRDDVTIQEVIRTAIAAHLQKPGQPLKRVTNARG